MTFSIVFFHIFKTILLLFYSLWAGSIGYAAYSDRIEFEKEPVAANTDGFIHAQVTDEGWDIYSLGIDYPNYHYGPSFVLNANNSVDAWFACGGTLGMWDFINYKQSPDGGKSWTDETIAMRPTAGGEDAFSTCDPGVIKIGEYYYLGYTSTTDERGTDNNVYVGRSKDPAGPYEKWTGSGWGTLPKPLIEYTGNPDRFGIGEPSFVLLGDTLYIYYSLCDEGATTCVATADATKENWPETLVFHGICIPAKTDGDSADVKYVDEYGRFIAVFTEKRFSEDSYIAVWESFDGLTFRQADVIKQNTAKRLHNSGISGRADGHIGKGDPVYIGYAYAGPNGSWGRWGTRMHELRLSTKSEATTTAEGQTNLDITPTTKKSTLLSDVTGLFTTKPVYTVKHVGFVGVRTFDSDGYTLPVVGVTFDGYDKSVVRMIGRVIVVVGSGSTRVTAHWKEFSYEFVVETE